MKNTEPTEEVCDHSRRNLLKKSYTAPAIIVLGSMSFSTDAKASWGNWGGSSSTSGSSSLSGGSVCNICFFSPCCC